MSAQSENEEFEFMAMAEEEAKRNKSLSLSNLQPSHDLADSRLPENRQENADPYAEAKQLGMKSVKLVGNIAGSLTTGPINAAAQGFQDEGFTPAGFGKALVSNQIKNLADPFRSGPNRIQSSEKSLERAGVPNQSREIMTGVPGFVMRERARSGSAGLTPADESKYRDDQIYQVPAHENGLAHDLGQAADMFTPAVGLSVAKPIMKGALKVGQAIAEPIGTGLQKMGTSQMNRVVSPLMRHERKANTPISEVIFKYGFDKPNPPSISGLDPANAEAQLSKRANPKTMFQRSGDKLKDLSQELRAHIQAGKDGGARVGIEKVIDDAVAELKSKRGETPDYFDYIQDVDGAAKDLKEKAALASGDGFGDLDLLQAQAFKQYTGTQGKWLQVAKSKGIKTTAKETADSRLSEKVNRILNETIDGLANGETANINRQISEIIPAHEALGWRQIVDNRKASLSLTDALSLMATAIDPKLAGLYAVNKASKSGTVASWMYRLGEKLRTAKTPEEAAKITSVFKKKGLSDSEIETLKAQIEPGKRPFLPSITGPDELAPRSRSGRPALGEQPPTYVPREGSIESPFGQPTPPAKPQFDPLEALDPRNRQSLPEGQGSIEDMAPPEMAQARQQDAQAAREAFVRQDRERQIGKVPLPVEQPLGDPQFRVIDRPIKKPPTQRELFGPSDLSYRRSKMFQYLQKTTGKDPFMSDVYKELEKLGKKDVPKAPEKEILKREFKGRTKPEDHAAMEDLLSNGGQGVETVTIKAEDAPKTFTLGGVEFTKGRTLYGKTIFKGIRDRKFMVSSDGLIHMDKPLDEVPF
jgi:hypothetical protein